MKVLIGGLLHKQETVIKSKCPEGMDLRFITTDKGPAQWAESARHADVCILITGFISHKISESVQKTGVKVIRFTGGLTRLKELLNELSNR